LTVCAIDLLLETSFERRDSSAVGTSSRPSGSADLGPDEVVVGCYPMSAGEERLDEVPVARYDAEHLVPPDCLEIVVLEA
jgi:hypothetical protein